MIYSEDINGLADSPLSIVGHSCVGHLSGGSHLYWHNKAHLLYVTKGVITIEADGGFWMVPPGCAIWLPEEIWHRGSSAGEVAYSSLYIPPSLTEGLGKKCGIVFIPPLLRELILRFAQDPHHFPQGNTRRTRLMWVLLDELQAAPFETLHLPIPQDRRLRRLANMLLSDPSLRYTIEEWGEYIGVSARTLSRLFQRETGMSFGRWKKQLQIGIGVQRLALKEPVTTIATDLGYESTSAFIAMFRRMLGTTPARYFDSIGKPIAESESPKLQRYTVVGPMDVYENKPSVP